MELHDLFDKLDREHSILQQMADMGVIYETADHHLCLMLDQVKRVRRASTMLTKALAQERDNRNATAQEAQANE